MRLPEGASRGPAAPPPRARGRSLSGPRGRRGPPAGIGRRGPEASAGRARCRLRACCGRADACLPSHPDTRSEPRSGHRDHGPRHAPVAVTDPLLPTRLTIRVTGISAPPYLHSCLCHCRPAGASVSARARRDGDEDFSAENAMPV